MNFKKVLSTIVSLIFLIWSLIAVWMYFNHNNVLIVYQLLVAFTGLLSIAGGWCLFGKDDDQSFEYLLKHDPIDFTIRLLLILLTCFIGLVNIGLFVPFFFAIFLAEKVTIFGVSQYSFAELWKNSKNKFVVLLAICVLFFMFIFV